jgi:hypothetical protein
LEKLKPPPWRYTTTGIFVFSSSSFSTFSFAVAGRTMLSRRGSSVLGACNIGLELIGSAFDATSLPTGDASSSAIGIAALKRCTLAYGIP